MDLNNLNDNIISRRWKERYATLSEETKEKLSAFKKMNPSEYQLQVIKRKRIYPEIGDIFELKTRHNVVIKGVVINNHIDNINGNDLILIFIFKMEIDILECLQNGNVYDSLLCMPKIVGSEYWSKGYFFNISHYNYLPDFEYGFYSVGKGVFCDEYGNQIPNEPHLLGIYGVTTIIGISQLVTKELIIAGIE